MTVPFVDLKAQYRSIRKEIDEAIKDVLEETAFIGGKHVKTFEQAFAALYGVKHVISCANGTDSLYIIMKMLGIGQNDEVITVANSWISSSETITQTGAKPVFIDIDPEYQSINHQLIAQAITPQTRALVLVHLHGQVCDMDFVVDICNRHDIHLIEDCAQAHFSEYKGRRAGTFGVAGSFSFYPGKNLGAYGDAGCIITNNDELARKFRLYANHGSLSKHKHEIEGINSRLDGLQAAILNTKLPYILSWTDQRITNAALYQKHLHGIPEIVLPKVRPETKHTFHLYVIRAQQRAELMSYLKENEVDTAIHYPIALPNLPAYSYLDNKPGDFPVATESQHQILSLPMFPELTEKQIAHVANSIRAFYQTQK